MFDLMGMMGKVKEMQARMAEAQESLARTKISGESGGGMVKAVVNGKRQLLSLTIDPVILNANDHGLVQDLIVAAFNKANEEAEVVAKETIRKSTEGILPSIPGLDLSSFMK